MEWPIRIKKLDAYEFFAAFLLANLLSLLVSPAPGAVFPGTPAHAVARGLDDLYAQAARHAASHRVAVVLCPVRWIYFQCDQRADWSRGAIGFADRNRNHDFDVRDELMRRQLPLPTHLRLRALGPWQVRFAPGSGRVIQDTPLLLCDLRGQARAWVLHRRDGRGFRARDASAKETALCHEEIWAPDEPSTARMRLRRV